MIGGASLLTLVMGAVYIVDCRYSAKSWDQSQACYLTGLPIMGVGGAAGGAFRVGFATYNPALREPIKGGRGPEREVIS
jgi:hypothetical protein